MATVYIDPAASSGSGGDGTTFNSWDDFQTNYTGNKDRTATGANDELRVKCAGTEMLVTGNVNITGWTCDADNKLIFEADDGEADGLNTGATFSESHFHIRGTTSTTSQPIITISSSYVELRHIQIDNDCDGLVNGSLNVAATNVTIHGCRFKKSGTGTVNMRCVSVSQSGCTLSSNVFYAADAGSWTACVYNYSSTTSFEIVNNTFINGGILLNSNPTGCVIKNNVDTGSKTVITTVANHTIKNNVADDPTITGEDHNWSLGDDANNFTDHTNDDLTIVHRGAEIWKRGDSSALPATDCTGVAYVATEVGAFSGAVSDLDIRRLDIGAVPKVGHGRYKQLDIGAVPYDSTPNWEVVGVATELLPNSAGTVTVSLPSGLQEDDLVIVFRASDQDLSTNGSGNLTGEGYTSLALSSAATPGYAIDYKVMGATPDTDVDIAKNTSRPTIALIVAIRGVDTSDIIDATLQTATGATGLPNPPSLTTSADNALRIAVGALDDDGGAAPDNGHNWPDVYVAGTTAGDPTGARIMVALYEEETAGARDPAAFTGTGDDQWWAGHFSLTLDTEASPPATDGEHLGLHNITSGYRSMAAATLGGLLQG